MKYPILHYLQLWKFPYISYSQQESKYLWHKLQNKQRMEGNSSTKGERGVYTWLLIKVINDFSETHKH